MRSRKEPRPLSSPFKALIELGGASAQVTFMPDSHWSSSSSSSPNSSSSSSSSSPLVDSNSSSHGTTHGSSGKEGSSLKVRLPGEHGSTSKDDDDAASSVVVLGVLEAAFAPCLG